MRYRRWEYNKLYRNKWGLLSVWIVTIKDIKTGEKYQYKEIWSSKPELCRTMEIGDMKIKTEFILQNNNYDYAENIP